MYHHQTIYKKLLCNIIGLVLLNSVTAVLHITETLNSTTKYTEHSSSVTTKHFTTSAKTFSSLVLGLNYLQLNLPAAENKGNKTDDHVFMRNVEVKEQAVS